MHPGIVSRRDVLPILAAPVATVALAGAAIAQPGPDPVFALIEAHRSAFDEFSRAVDLLEDAEKLSAGDHRLTVARHLWDQTNDAEAEALDAVTSCRPTTLAGIVALARYVEAHERRSHGPSAEDCRSWQALGAMAGALANLTLPAPAAAVASSVSAPALEADADLKALFARWQSVQAELDVINGMTLDEYVALTTDEAVTALCGDAHRLAHEVYAHPATGVEALKMKAEVARQQLSDDPYLIESMAFRSVFDGIAALSGGRL